MPHDKTNNINSMELLSELGDNMANSNIPSRQNN